MLKILSAAAIVTASMIAPAIADDMMACDDASFMKAEEMAKAATGDKMTNAMSEVEMARMAMKDDKTDECKTHLDAAMKASM
jgi:hypothetical protein